MNAIPLIAVFIALCMLYGVSVYTVSLYNGQRLKIRKDYSYTPKVSIILSAFNEGQAVYETICSLKRLNYPGHLLEIIAFNDCSKDDTWDWMLRAQAEFEGVRIFTNPHNMGKAPTMAIAARHTTGDIIISTDADAVFHPDAVRELVCCFGEPSVGAVGGSIRIENANSTLLTQMQTVSYGTSYGLFKPMENMIGATQCLGGPLAAFRREIYLDIVPEVLSRNFFGQPLHNGDDRFITQCVLLRGWKTYTNVDAQCWVGTPTSWGNYFKQQLRWRRSGLGQLANTMSNLSDYLKRAGVLQTIGSVLPIMSIIVWLMLVIWMIMSGNVLQIAVSFFIMKLFIAPIYIVGFNHIFKSIDPSQTVDNPILCAFFLPVWFVINILIVVPWALFTLDDGGWVTRQDGLTGNA